VLDSLGGEHLDKSLTSQARRPGDRRDRPPGPRVRKAARGAEVHRRRDGAAEPKVAQAGPEAGRQLLVPVRPSQRRPAAQARRPPTTPATSARSSTRRSRSTRPSTRWRTSNMAAPTARSSSPSTDSRERRRPPSTPDSPTNVSASYTTSRGLTDEDGLSRWLGPRAPLRATSGGG